MTDQELQIELARLLPEKIHITDGAAVGSKCFFWFNNEVAFVGSEMDEVMRPLLDTEWLHACWLIERNLTLDERGNYWNQLQRVTEKGRMATSAWLTTNASWQQRAKAILAVKGVK